MVARYICRWIKRSFLSRKRNDRFLQLHFSASCNLNRRVGNCRRWMVDGDHQLCVFSPGNRRQSFIRRRPVDVYTRPETSFFSMRILRFPPPRIFFLRFVGKSSRRDAFIHVSSFLLHRISRRVTITRNASLLPHSLVNEYLYSRIR